MDRDFRKEKSENEDNRAWGEGGLYFDPYVDDLLNEIDRLRKELNNLKKDNALLQGSHSDMFKELEQMANERFTMDEMDKAVDNHVNKLQKNNKDYWTTILKGNWNGIKGELKKTREIMESD